MISSANTSSADSRTMSKRWFRRSLIPTCIFSFVSIFVQLPPVPAVAVEDGVTVGSNPSRTWNVYVTANDGRYICSGSLIARQWVMTAGHCVTSIVNEVALPVDDPKSVPLYYKTYAAKSMHVMIGRPDLDDSSAGVERTIDEVVVHPQFQRFAALNDKPEFRCTVLYVNRMCKSLASTDDGEVAEFIKYDIALLRLSTPVPASFTPVTLAPTLPPDGTDTFLYGYGKTSAGGKPSRQLQLTRFGSYQVGCGGPDSYRDWAFCLARTGRSQSRPGDSGGPWLIGVNGSPQQIGVNSGSSDHSVRAAPIPPSIGWIRDTANIPAPTAFDPNSVAMALIIDSSGSMADNDPKNRRIDAGQAYLTAAGASDAVGVVDFDSAARIASEAVNPKTSRTQLEQALNSIDSSGGTDIGAGVRGGCDVLSRSGNQPVKAAILLTDGDGAYSGQNSCFKSKGWKLYTFGLGSDVKDSLLTTIATETGGRYKSLATVDNLICEFQQIRAAVAGSALSGCPAADLIKLGQTIIKKVSVSPRLLQAVFSISWPGSDIGMTLVSPSGRRITVDTDAFDVSTDKGSTFKTISVYKPEPGQWSVELLGIAVKAAGEPVSLSTAQIPLANKPPTAVIGEATLLDPATGRFRLTAAGSTDTDGKIVDYLWDFGDGLAGAGNAVEHRFPQPGKYTVQLTVVDNALDTSVVSRQIEIPPFLKPVTFTLAGQAGQSAIYATGTPKSGKTEGTVLGLVRGRPIPATAITEAGLTTIGGNEVLLVRFTVAGIPWELRYRSLFYGIGVVDVCGPAGCEAGTGVRFDTAAIPLAAFTPFGITIPGGGTGAPAVSTTQARCAQLQAQLDVTTVQSVRLQLITAMRALGCPP